MNSERLLMTPQESLFSQTSQLESPKGEVIHNELISVTGVSCVGKGTLLAKVQQELGGRDDIHWLNGGTLVSKHLGGIDRDKLRYLPFPEFINAMMLMGDEVVANTPAVHDSHHVVKHQGQHLFNPGLERLLLPKQYLVITSDPDAIYQWRIKNNEKGERVRDIENPDIIYNHQQKIIDSLRGTAKQNGSGLTVIYNAPDDSQQMDKNIAVMKSIIEELKQQ